MKFRQRQVSDPRAQENFEQLQGILTPAAWREVGGTGEPAFESSWVNVGGAYETAAFRLATTKVVALKGSVKSGNLATTVFTLPAAYRPTKDRRLSIAVFDGAAVYPGLLYISTAGAVQVFAGAGAVNPIDEAHIDGLFAL